MSKHKLQDKLYFINGMALTLCDILRSAKRSALNQGDVKASTMLSDALHLAEAIRERSLNNG